MARAIAERIRVFLALSKKNRKLNAIIEANIAQTKLALITKVAEVDFWMAEDKLTREWSKG